MADGGDPRSVRVLGSGDARRVLAHPELELVALGSDSLAGQPATRARPPARRNGTLAARLRRRTTRRSRAAPTSSSSASTTIGRPRSSRPPEGVVVDLSGAHRLADAAHYRLVRLRPPAPPVSRLVVRPAGAFPPDRPADRESRLLCNRRAARARAARGCDRSDVGRRRREVRRLGRRQDAEGELARRRRARERRALPGRQRTSTARDRAAARLPRLLRPAPAARPPRAARDVLRASRDRRRPARAARGGLRASPRWALLPEDEAPELARVAGHRRAPRSESSRTGATGRAIVDLRDRQPRQGRGRPGRPERQPRARPRRDRRAAAAGVLV